MAGETLLRKGSEHKVRRTAGMDCISKAEGKPPGDRGRTTDFPELRSQVTGEVLPASEDQLRHECDATLVS